MDPGGTMAIKLDKAQSKEKAELVEKLKKAREALEEKFDEFVEARTKMVASVEKFIEEANQQLSEARGKLEDEVTAYNELVSAADSLRDGVFNEYETEIDAKSDKWRDSDAGQKAREWLGHYEEQFEEVTLDSTVTAEFKVEDFEEIAFLNNLEGALDLHEKLEEMPEEPEET
jgi:hypothetical protein